MLKEIFSVGLSAMILDGLLIISSLMFNYYAMKLVVVLFIFRRFVVTCFSHDTQVIYIAAFILTVQFFHLSLRQVQGFWQEFFMHDGMCDVLFDPK